jgi:hypothetical protein
LLAIISDGNRVPIANPISIFFTFSIMVTPP